MTSPNLIFITGALAKYMQHPRRQHQEAIKCVFCYVSGTREYGITYHSGDATVLVGYSDADWSNAENSKSVSGLVFTLHGAAVSWRAKTQTSLSLSTAEAELMVAARAAQEALYLLHLLRDLGYEQMAPTVIFEDNQACISMSKHPTQRERCRYIDCLDNFISDQVEKGNVEL
eukprot:836999-Rhodomonas_salina.1